MESNRHWEIWKTVELGTHTTTRSLREAVGSQGFIRDYIYEDLFRRIEISPVRKTLNLAKLTAADFGFRDPRDSGQASKESAEAWSNNCRDSSTQLLEPGATYHFRQLYKRALDNGLQLCPSEVAFQLLLQHPDTLKDAPRGYDHAYVGMEPMAVQHPGGYEDDPYTENKVFVIRHGTISATYGLGSFWRVVDPYWIFVLPRRLAS
ncbi:MAG: hypothetical protein Q8R55_01310 [Candidatus Taylorbacteria bacterium]|nr:hypothetical protein [Candidatus Taylorbacteria bacterium]